MAVKFGNGIDLDNNRIINLADPSNATDAVNRQYVDAMVRGLSWKLAVRAATTTDGNLSTAYEAGQSIDGVVLQAGDRILLKDQANASENGIYVVKASGAPERAPDADSEEELRAATVTVREGTVNEDRVYRLITDDVELGETDLVWTEIGGAGQVYSAGNGLTETPAGTFNVGAGAGISVGTDSVSLASTVAGGGLTFSSGVINVGAGTGITVNANDVAIDTSIVARKVSANVGNGSATSIAVNHNLGTRDVVVSVRNNTSPYEEIITDVEHTDENTVTLQFSSAPASNEYRVTVVG